MTNQEKFIQIFGIDVWQQMIVFSGLAVNFKEYWMLPYNETDCQRCIPISGVFEDIKNEFINNYPKNVYGGLELNGCSCVFSLNKVLEIIDNYIKGKDPMAIKALEQDSCEDCISRQAAIDAFEKFIHELGIEDEPYNYGEMALSVQNVPSVNPQSKIGHWIYSIYGDFHEQGNWLCSHCNYQFNHGNGQAEYCPKCGYEMSEAPTEEVISEYDQR